MVAIVCRSYDVLDSFPCATVSARAQEGSTPIGEAHDCPPNSPDPQMQASTVREPETDNPMACVRTHQAREACS